MTDEGGLWKWSISVFMSSVKRTWTRGPALCTLMPNFNVPTSYFIGYCSYSCLNIQLFIYLHTFLNFFLNLTLFSLIICIFFLPVLYMHVKGETSFPKVRLMTELFLLWVLVYRSNDGLKNGPEIVTLEVNYVVHDGTLLKTFINPSTTGMCRLRIIRLNCCKQKCPTPMFHEHNLYCIP